MFGVGINRRARVKDARARILNGGGLLGERRFAASEDDGGGAVSEEPAGDEIGHGIVVLLPGKGAEFDREQKRVLFGEGAHIVGGAGDAGGSGDTAEAEDGGALDVCGEAHEVDETGVDAGAGDAGDGGEEDGGDIRLGRVRRGRERSGWPCSPSSSGALDPGIVGWAKAGERS